VTKPFGTDTHFVEQKVVLSTRHMRHHYQLTSATRKTLTDNVKAFARALDNHVSRFYRILSNDETDPFAPFEAFYEGACAEGISTEHWDNALAAIRKKYDRPHTPSLVDCATGLIESGSEVASVVVKAAIDGQIDEREAHDIIEAADRATEHLTKVKNLALVCTKVRELGNGVVMEYRARKKAVRQA
jgi:hypothetical protein